MYVSGKQTMFQYACVCERASEREYNRQLMDGQLCENAVLVLDRKCRFGCQIEPKNVTNSCISVG